MVKFTVPTHFFIQTFKILTLSNAETLYKITGAIMLGTVHHLEFFTNNVSETGTVSVTKCKKGMNGSFSIRPIRES